MGSPREVGEGEGGSGEGVRRVRGGRIEVVTKKRGRGVGTVAIGWLRRQELIYKYGDTSQTERDTIMAGYCMETPL